MRMLKNIFLALLIISVTTACTQEKDNRIKELDEFFTKAYKDDKLNGNVLVAEKGIPLYQKSFGKADRVKNLDLNSETIFELASVSKQFTAMGIMLLRKQGKLSYDDSLRKFFPELPYHNISVRQLLNHTSGLPDYMGEFSKYWDNTRIATNDDMIALLAKYKPDTLFAPGNKWEYSNTGYALLASIIEKASGKKYGDYLHQYIFKPLAMEKTRVFRRRYEKTSLDNYAYGYLMDPVTNKYLLPDSIAETANMVYTLDGIQGDGVVNSTTGDLLKWDRALYTEKLLSKEEMAEALRPGVLNNGKKTNYGFGWMIGESKNFGAFVQHSGGWPGYTTFIERHTGNDKTIIILQNNGKALPSIPSIRNILYGIKTEAVKEVKTSVEELKQYVGDYEIVPDFVLSVTVKDEKIFVQATGQSAAEIFKEKTDIFFLKVVEAKLQFTRDEKGQVDAVVLLQGGQELKGLKKK
jgi:CubicO group peptidase (beta-lactamase class C family)